MGKVIHVIDDACTSGAVSEASLLAGDEPLVCIGPPPAELAGGADLARLARPNKWSSALSAGARPAPRILRANPIAHCWSVSAAVDLWTAAGYADTTLLIRLTERPAPADVDRLAELCQLARAKVICASEADEIALKQALGPADVRTIGPLTADAPPSPSRRGELREQMGVGPDEMLFVAPGPMRRGSGHRRAIWAVTVLTVIELPVKLLLQDLGPTASDVARFVERTAFTEFAVWADAALPLTDLTDAADAAVFLADTSPPPVLLTGAMRGGLPVVAARGSAPPMLIHGETALLARSDSPREIAREMLRLIEQDGLARRLGAAARAVAEQTFNPDTIRRQWADLYEAVAPPDGNG